MKPHLAGRRERGMLSPRILGMLLVAVGLLANRWVLGLFAPDGRIDGEWRNAQIFGGQVLLVLAGLAAWLAPVREWLAARRRRILLAGAVIPALAVLSAYSGYGLYLYLTQHQHTINADRSGLATPEQLQWAEDIQKRAWEVALENGWFDFDKARRDGYVLQWGDREHYVKYEYIFDDEVLNIEKPEFLMYLDSPRGKLLVGYMFYTRNLEEHGPTPFGPLGAWHFHPWPGRGYCAIEKMVPVSRPDENGRCAKGERVDRSAEMFHVYLIDHPLGPFTDAMVFPAADSPFEVAWIHPILVHFTVALFLLAAGLDVLGWLLRREALHRVAFVNLSVAAVASIGTMAAGMAAEMHVVLSARTHDLVHTHKSFAFAVVACVVTLAVWRAVLRGRFPRRAAPIYLVLALGGAGLTVTAAYLGGELVYRHGVAVSAIDRFAMDAYLRKVDAALGRAPLPREP
ncbi:MAG: DUF2231 domain-containing protein [Gammaproteobacteria bacterium]